MKYALVAVGYNRLHSMERLLKSLERADYGGDSIELYVSIDNSGSDAVEKFVEGFKWTHGEKHILTYPQRQGLRNHIMGLGRLLDEYDAIAMFEDDVVVGEGFYSYMKQAVEFYRDDDQIAGISLYTNLWNEFANAPFIPVKSPYDTYFFNFAESRGQVWLKRQWKAYKEWYDGHSEYPLDKYNIPEYVLNWPGSSWKKYHIAYCVTHHKYFVYPYDSVVTIFSEPGSNTIITTTNIQVPLQQGIKKSYNFSSLNDKDSVFYDVYYERMLGDKSLGQGKYSECCFDLYGIKKSYGDKKYVYTTKRLDYEVIETFGLQMKPHEVNIFYGVPGDEICKYNLFKPCKNVLKDNKTRIYRYRFNLFSNYGRVFICILDAIVKKIKRDLNKIGK